MKKGEYEKMYLLEDSHFWFVGKRFFINTYLNKIKSDITDILDVGSGTGGTTKLLKNYGKVIGIEKNSYGRSLARKRGLKIIKGEAEKIPFKNDRFNLVTIFDVLYHQDVENVGNVLKEAFRVLRPKGYILITDSVFSFLKGAHSRPTYERRRFTSGQLIEALETNGFMIKRHSYLFFSLFPWILLKRTFIDRFFKSEKSDVFPIPKVINFIFIFLLKLESLLLNNISFPIGSSLIILAEKK